MNYIKTKFVDCDKIFVFGTGRFADKFVELYHKDYDIKGVVDNNPQKQGSIWKGFIVSSPDVLKRVDGCTVIVCIKDSEPVIQQLRDMGINSVAVYDAHRVYPGRQTADIPFTGKKYHIGFCRMPNIVLEAKFRKTLRRAKEQCDYLIAGIPAGTEFEKNEEADEIIELSENYKSPVDLYEKFHFDVWFEEESIAENYWKQYLEKQYSAVELLPDRKERIRESTVLMQENKSISRLGVYSFYDKDGVVDDYVIHFLDSFIKETKRTVVVSNGELTEEGAEQIKALGCELLVRENKGFDAWGIRTGLLHVGMENLDQYDEILIANNTVFGPVHPLSVMLTEMSRRDIDFWGCSSHPGFHDFDPYESNPYGYVPEHIQSYFYAIRKPMFTDVSFRDFWENLPPLTDYKKAIGLYETVMTKYFSDEGFLWDTYMPADEYYAMTDNPLITMPVESIQKWKCPFIKRRAFFQDYDYYSTYTGQHTVSQLLRFLQEETDYPLGLIFDNLIRTCHMSDLVQNAHLTRILEKRPQNGLGNPETGKKTAFFVHIYDMSMLPTLSKYLGNLSDETDLYISTTSEEKKSAILDAFRGPRSVQVRVLPNRGRDVSALLVSFRDVVFDYDLIGVTHDKKSAHLKPGCVGEGFAYIGYENTLADRKFIEAVFREFESDPYLGFLCAPGPNHADFVTHIGMEWGSNYDCTLALYRELGLTVPIDRDHPPVAPFGSSFWCRTEALKPLFRKNWTYEDFPTEPLGLTDGTIMHAVERIYPYAAQEAGYYSAPLMTMDYAALELDNLHYYARDYTHACWDNDVKGLFINVRKMVTDRLDMLGK